MRRCLPVSSVGGYSACVALDVVVVGFGLFDWRFFLALVLFVKLWLFSAFGVVALVGCGLVAWWPRWVACVLYLWALVGDFA